MEVEMAMDDVDDVFEAAEAVWARRAESSRVRRFTYFDRNQHETFTRDWIPKRRGWTRIWWTDNAFLFLL